MRRTILGVLLASLTFTLGACAQGGGDPTEKANAALRQAQIENVDVEWEQEGRFLILRGEVESEAEVAKAGQVAEEAVGKTAQVINELEVRGGAEVTPDTSAPDPMQ